MKLRNLLPNKIRSALSRALGLNSRNDNEQLAAELIAPLTEIERIQVNLAITEIFTANKDPAFWDKATRKHYAKTMIKSINQRCVDHPNDKAIAGSTWCESCVAEKLTELSPAPVKMPGDPPPSTYPDGSLTPYGIWEHEYGTESARKAFGVDEVDKHA